MSGGTPNYTARLLEHHPGLARYAAMAYFQGWASVPSLSAILLSDLLVDNLAALGIKVPGLPLTVLFAAAPFVVAFSGTRTLSVLHLVFLVPAVGSLLAFCLQGLGWLAVAPSSPGLLPADPASLWSHPDLIQLAKWFFVATYAVYSVETASSFVADSRRARSALQGLTAATWLLPVVFVGGSWVLMRAGADPAGSNDGGAGLLAAAGAVWGGAAPWLLTFLIATGSLLSLTTGTANSPRIVHQLARDGLAAPVFAPVSRRNVAGPALALTLLVTLGFYLFSTEPTAVLVVTSTGWFFSFIALHLALWLRRGQPEVRRPWWSLAWFAIEVPIFVVGGLAWGAGWFLLGLLVPLALVGVDAAIQRLPLGVLRPGWWVTRYTRGPRALGRDPLVAQVLLLIGLVTAASAGSWLLSTLGGPHDAGARTNLLVLFMVAAGFVTVALASRTTLSQLQRIEEAGERATVEAQSLLVSARDAVLIVDDEGVVTSANPAAQRQFSSDRLRGRPACELLPGFGPEPENWPARSEQLLAGPEQVLTTIETTVSAARSGHRQDYFLVVRDVTERKALEEQLAYQAFHDPLTNLPNRALFRDRLEHALVGSRRRNRPLAVLFLDLDDFKRVNDSLGHATGDQLLIAVAKRLQDCLRAEDTAARLGGDEFAILLEDATEPAAVEVAERILAALRSPVQVAGNQLLTQASMGIATCSSCQIAAGELLRSADLAMYVAKGRGKGHYELAHPGMHQAAHDRAALEADLRRALERHQLVLHYQPIVLLATGRITAVEALVRWQHPQQGLLPPAAFIPLAEDTGLINAVGTWVLQQACRQARGWQERYPSDPPLTVSVNVSAGQLGPGLVDTIARTLADTGLAPNCLMLEITETLLMRDTTQAVAQLRQLRTLGIQVAIDDFGVGYSSLSRLGSFPVNKLKIDKSFIDEIADPDTAAPLVATTIALAHGLGLDAVAEGVETPAQWAFLRRHGCIEGQGYLFSRPIEPDRIDQLLADPARTLTGTDGTDPTVAASTSIDRELHQLITDGEAGLDPPT